MSKPFDLGGKVALILGGSGGIGRALASGLGEAGARLFLCGRDGAKLEGVVNGLRQAGHQASGFVADARDPAGFDPLFERVAGEAGRLDLLINCQGINIIKPTADFTVEDYDAVMDTNLKSVFFACQAARRLFLAQDGQQGAQGGARGGSIINIASLSAHRGWPGAVIYGVSKHGIVGLTKGLAAEWAGDGIRVNAISPGFFMTDMNRERMSADRKQLALARTPARRFGEVEELAGAAVYLASDAAGFVTGADIAVDGGFLASGL
jgi:NAD(P)-dependent dehydrogenase (short-subunit alcohol dehydrogenase family)